MKSVNALALTVWMAAVCTPAVAQEGIKADYFIGRWGQVSYNSESDLPKMIGMAREFCGPLATVITKRSPATFMMYVTEKLKEVEILPRDGKLFVVPVEAEEGVLKGARELEVHGPNAFSLRYLEPEHASRYGPNVFVRCQARAEPKSSAQAPDSQGQDSVAEAPRKTRKRKTVRTLQQR